MWPLPCQVKNVGKLLKKYKGREEQLIRKIHKKYDVEEDDKDEL